MSRPESIDHSTEQISLLNRIRRRLGLGYSTYDPVLHQSQLRSASISVTEASEAFIRLMACPSCGEVFEVGIVHDGCRGSNDCD